MPLLTQIFTCSCSVSLVSACAATRCAISNKDIRSSYSVSIVSACPGTGLLALCGRALPRGLHCDPSYWWGGCNVSMVRGGLLHSLLATFEHSGCVRVAEQEQRGGKTVDEIAVSNRTDFTLGEETGQRDVAECLADGPCIVVG